MPEARLKIHEPKKTVPRRIDAYLKVDDKQVAFTHVFGAPSGARPSILVVADRPTRRNHVESALVWEGTDTSGGDVVQRPTADWTYDDAYKALKSMHKGNASGRDVLKGQWRGTIAVDGHFGSTVELKRKIATYVELLVRTGQSGGCWDVFVNVQDQGRWYVVKGPESDSECVASSLESALVRAVELGREAVSQSCVIRDTVRRQSRDPEYAKLRPIREYREPTRTPTDRFRENGASTAPKAGGRKPARDTAKPKSSPLVVVEAIPENAPARAHKTWSALWRALAAKFKEMGGRDGWTSTTSKRIVKLMESGEGASTRLHRKGAAALGQLLNLPELKGAETDTDTTEAKRVWNYILSHPGLYDWIGEGCGCGQKSGKAACECGGEGASNARPGSDRVDLSLLDMGLGVTAYVGSYEALVSSVGGRYVVTMKAGVLTAEMSFTDVEVLQQTLRPQPMSYLPLVSGRSRPFSEVRREWEEYLAEMLLGWGIERALVAWAGPDSAGGEAAISVPAGTAWPEGRSVQAVELELRVKGFPVQGVRVRADLRPDQFDDLRALANTSEGFVGAHPVRVTGAPGGKCRLEWRKDGRVERVYHITAEQRAAMVTSEPKPALALPDRRPRQNRAPSWERWGRQLLLGWGIKRGRVQFVKNAKSKASGVLISVPTSESFPHGRHADTVALELKHAGLPVCAVRQEADDSHAGFTELQLRQSTTNSNNKLTQSGDLSPVGHAIFAAAQATLFNELGLSPT